MTRVITVDYENPQPDLIAHAAHEILTGRLVAFPKCLEAIAGLAQKVDVILARDFGESGLGLAIRDRLRRAASRVITE